jgi:hypothetical protein
MDTKQNRAPKNCAAGKHQPEQLSLPREGIVADRIQISTDLAICSELLTGIESRRGIECGLGVNFAPDESPEISGRWSPGRVPRCLGEKPRANKQLDSGMHSGLIRPMVQNTSSKTLRSVALAKATGVSPDTIRHYERIGVLPRASRTEPGYRIYPLSAVERVLVVQRALRIGFTLAELDEAMGFSSRQDHSSFPPVLRRWSY